MADLEEGELESDIEIDFYDDEDLTQKSKNNKKEKVKLTSFQNENIHQKKLLEQQSKQRRQKQKQQANQNKSEEKLQQNKQMQQKKPKQNNQQKQQQQKNIGANININKNGNNNQISQQSIQQQNLISDNKNQVYASQVNQEFDQNLNQQNEIYKYNQISNIQNPYVSSQQFNNNTIKDNNYYSPNNYENQTQVKFNESNSNNVGNVYYYHNSNVQQNDNQQQQKYQNIPQNNINSYTYQHQPQYHQNLNQSQNSSHLNLQIQNQPPNQCQQNRFQFQPNSISQNTAYSNQQQQGIYNNQLYQQQQNPNQQQIHSNQQNAQINIPLQYPNIQQKQQQIQQQKQVQNSYNYSYMPQYTAQNSLGKNNFGQQQNLPNQQQPSQPSYSYQNQGQNQLNIQKNILSKSKIQDQTENKQNFYNSQQQVQINDQKQLNSQQINNNNSKGGNNNSQTKNQSAGKNNNDNQKVANNNNINNNKNNKNKGNNFKMTTTSYKKQPCEFFKKGACQKGATCTYSHDPSLLDESKNQLCKYFVQGQCQKQDCVFSHDKSNFPCKFLFAKGNCEKMHSCEYSHSRFQSEQEIEDFMEQNYEFLKAEFNKNGTTGLGDKFIEYSKKKEEKQAKDNFVPGLFFDIDENNQKNQKNLTDEKSKQIQEKQQQEQMNNFQNKSSQKEQKFNLPGNFLMDQLNLQPHLNQIQNNLQDQKKDTKSQKNDINENDQVIYFVPEDLEQQILSNQNHKNKQDVKQQKQNLLSVQQEKVEQQIKDPRLQHKNQIKLQNSQLLKQNQQKTEKKDSQNSQKSEMLGNLSLSNISLQKDNNVNNNIQQNSGLDALNINKIQNQIKGNQIQVQQKKNEADNRLDALAQLNLPNNLQKTESSIKREETLNFLESLEAEIKNQKKEEQKISQQNQQHQNQKIQQENAQIFMQNSQKQQQQQQQKQEQKRSKQENNKLNDSKIKLDQLRMNNGVINNTEKEENQDFDQLEKMHKRLKSSVGKQSLEKLSNNQKAEVKIKPIQKQDNQKDNIDSKYDQEMEDNFQFLKSSIIGDPKQENLTQQNIITKSSPNVEDNFLRAFKTNSIYKQNSQNNSEDAKLNNLINDKNQNQKELQKSLNEGQQIPLLQKHSESENKKQTKIQILDDLLFSNKDDEESNTDQDQNKNQQKNLLSPKNNSISSYIKNQQDYNQINNNINGSEQDFKVDILDAIELEEKNRQQDEQDKDQHQQYNYYYNQKQDYDDNKEQNSSAQKKTKKKTQSNVEKEMRKLKKGIEKQRELELQKKVSDQISPLMIHKQASFQNMNNINSAFNLESNNNNDSSSKKLASSDQLFEYPYKKQKLNFDENSENDSEKKLQKSSLQQLDILENENVSESNNNNVLSSGQKLDILGQLELSNIQKSLIQSQSGIQQQEDWDKIQKQQSYNIQDLSDIEIDIIIELYKIMGNGNNAEEIKYVKSFRKNQNKNEQIQIYSDYTEEQGLKFINSAIQNQKQMQKQHDLYKKVMNTEKESLLIKQDLQNDDILDKICDNIMENFNEIKKIIC